MKRKSHLSVLVSTRHSPDWVWSGEVGRPLRPHPLHRKWWVRTVIATLDSRGPPPCNTCEGPPATLLCGRWEGSHFNTTLHTTLLCGRWEGSHFNTTLHTTLLCGRWERSHFNTTLHTTLLCGWWERSHFNTTLLCGRWERSHYVP